MKKLSHALISLSLLGVSLLCLSRGNFSNKKINVVDAAEVDAVSMREISDYLSTKKEHYPLSDEFIERYQQTSGGYIQYAKQLGLTVDKELHLPDQKWHFFTSWIGQSLTEGTLSYEDDAKTRVYNGLLCPELLLWIYEASSVDPNKVREAKIVAEQGKVAGTNVSTIAKNMRACVPWEDIKANIRSGK